MRTAFALLLLAASQFCLAQKWVDENGKVYYGAPPAGMHVKPAPMTGGATSTVGAQQQPVIPLSEPPGGFQPDYWLHSVREEHRRQQAEQAIRERDQVQERDHEAIEAARQWREEWHERQSDNRAYAREAAREANEREQARQAAQRERMLERSRSR